MSKTIVLKLVSGEEVMARVNVANSNEEVLSVDSPRVLSLHDAGGGRFGASFIPLLILGKDDNITIRWSSVVAYTYSISKEHEDRYLEQVSGLTLTSSLAGV